MISRQASSQLTYTRSLESLYVQRIRDILVPILGEDGVRAQVVADVDFTMVETTTESYQPDNRAVRSEEISRKRPAVAVLRVYRVHSVTSHQQGGTTGTVAVLKKLPHSVNSSSRATRNYELDHSVSHSRTAPGDVRRLSVAVVVDYSEQAREDGTLERVPLGEEEMARITALVKDAVGYDAERNDSVNVSNISFKVIEEMEPVPEAPVWEQAWLWDVGKKVTGWLDGVAAGIWCSETGHCEVWLLIHRHSRCLATGDAQLISRHWRRTSSVSVVNRLLLNCRKNSSLPWPGNWLQKTRNRGRKC